ncbi:hypothetical protein DFS34DRAFT_271951 [Phlyctochytrium arcticum]|nr:hypothetical protein DFS34DRAFT_271951 [Phlyctochytrium arcticum]
MGKPMAIYCPSASPPPARRRPTANVVGGRTSSTATLLGTTRPSASGQSRIGRVVRMPRTAAVPPSDIRRTAVASSINTVSSPDLQFVAVSSSVSPVVSTDVRRTASPALDLEGQESETEEVSRALDMYWPSDMRVYPPDRSNASGQSRIGRVVQIPRTAVVPPSDIRRTAVASSINTVSSPELQSVAVSSPLSPVSSTDVRRTASSTLDSEGQEFEMEEVSRAMDLYWPSNMRLYPPDSSTDDQRRTRANIAGDNPARLGIQALPSHRLASRTPSRYPSRHLHDIVGPGRSQRPGQNLRPANPRRSNDARQDILQDDFFPTPAELLRDGPPSSRGPVRAAHQPRTSHAADLLHPANSLPGDDLGPFGDLETLWDRLLSSHIAPSVRIPELEALANTLLAASHSLRAFRREAPAGLLGEERLPLIALGQMVDVCLNILYV